MKDILHKVDDAELILIGLGEEFDNEKSLKNIQHYDEVKEALMASPYSWLFPAYQQLRREASQDHVLEGLNKLAERLQDKNYFVVSTSTNDGIRRVSWKEGRLVMPCGGSMMKQCTNGCPEELIKVSEKDWIMIRELFQNGFEGIPEGFCLGYCSQCGKPYILNNVYTEKYNEKGYLSDWQIYTKWLQGTLNKKLFVLELGVGMQYPSIIRFPFEKIALYNNKAEIYRINEKLYYLGEELKQKGTSISKNAIDWLQCL